MKNLGILILAAGLALGLYSITMDVSVSVAAKDYGYGIQTPAMEVANIHKMSQRQNFMIFSGILSVVGAILLGFGSLRAGERIRVSPDDAQLVSPEVRDNDSPDELLLPTENTNSYSICPKCRHMGRGDDEKCRRCELTFAQ